MNKTKIDWCDSTWNPVTGCLHVCEYCYARNIAHRFGGYTELRDTDLDYQKLCESEIMELQKPLKFLNDKGKELKAPYPFYFMPTFHRYRLDEPQKWKKGRNVFVCSMADLFGDWVPDSWIEEVFKACEKAPQHNYLFLTKNPKRYVELINNSVLGKTGNNMWFGYSFTNKENTRWWNPDYNIFVSIEPILERVEIPMCKWIIVGAETGRRKEKVIPQREWIEHIVYCCKQHNIPIFMKSSLADIWGEPLIQEFPKELRK
ncbi:MAG: phage Gp37/Gp68 family protein [Muribaculaceae bacterium]|nr:phage Gp37/Gp68 family protein [Muribaculaceae bacterium]MCM1399882.1 phage Gp37/Gp68 family protein [Clostridium sp.]MCM1460632.1 phage Gp37/Gp68 family protein [Bacteroides sp.]